MTFEELQKALGIFNLSARIIFREIKSRHRELVRRSHPDRGEAHDPERIRQVNAAYRVLPTLGEEP